MSLPGAPSGSVAAAIRMTTQLGEGIIVQPPVYYRYAQAADRIGRKTIYNPLKMVGGRYEMDFENLEHCMEDSKNRLMILCNPHNPIGQVWSPDHLAKVARLARRYGVTVFSDEIFLPKQCITGILSSHIAKRQTPGNMRLFPLLLGKAFSLTGVNYANLIIPDKTLREAFIAQRNADHYGSIEPLIHAALLSAYTNEGARWVKEMNDYVLENIRLVRRFFSEHLPQVRAFESEGAFVLWIDWRGLGLTAESLHVFLEEQALFLTDRGEEYAIWRGRVYPDEHGVSAR